MIKEQNYNVKFVSIMPCYDKKLEAVRPTILVPNKEVEEIQPHMEVDTVLATHELLELFEKLEVDFKAVQPMTHIEDKKL